MNINTSGSSFFAAYTSIAASTLASNSTPLATPNRATLHSELQDDTTRHIVVPTPPVKLELSSEGQRILSEDGEESTETSETKKSSSQEMGPKAPNGRTLSQEEIEVIQKLRSRDAEVRAHENAHISAAGGLASAASYSYQSGPDGKRYAIGGHVSIDTSPGRTPQETLMKAERIRSAALAPADPSPQDRAVAAQATQMASSARAQMSAERQEEAQKALEKQDEDGTDTESTDSSTSSTAEKAYNEFQTDSSSASESLDIVA